MITLKQIWLIPVNLCKQINLGSSWLANLPERRKQRAKAAIQETERLDRIRNPSKYLGK
jgi:hypothetical protein